MTREADKTSVQDRFLATLCRSRVSVYIHIVNGIKLQGQISEFDRFVILLKNQKTQKTLMVYKQAISTIGPLEESPEDEK